MLLWRRRRVVAASGDESNVTVASLVVHFLCLYKSQHYLGTRGVGEAHKTPRTGPPFKTRFAKKNSEKKLTRRRRYKFPSSRRIWSSRHRHCNERCHLVFALDDVSADFENANENR